MDKKSMRILELLRKKEKLTFKEIKPIDGNFDHPQHDPHLIFLINSGYIEYTNDNEVFYNKIKPEDATFKITRSGH